MPKPLKLNEEEESLLHLLNWMEYSYRNEVYVIDIDFDTGAVALFGEPHLTKKFRGEMNNMMADIYASINSWREF